MILSGGVIIEALELIFFLNQDSCLFVEQLNNTSIYLCCNCTDHAVIHSSRIKPSHTNSFSIPKLLPKKNSTPKYIIIESLVNVFHLF